MKRYIFILTFIGIAYAQGIQYDYKVKIYPVSNVTKKDKVSKNHEVKSYSKKYSKKNSPVVVSSRRNLRKEDIRALIYRILKEIEINRKLIKSLNKTYNEDKIIAKLEKILQNNLYLSRKYTYSYIKKILEDYQNEIIAILEESQNNLKKDLENKVVKAKNDLSSLITQSSLDIKDNLDIVKSDVQQISSKVEEISQSNEELKDNILSSFDFIKYLLIAISIIIIAGFIFLAIKVNKSNNKEDYEEEQ